MVVRSSGELGIWTLSRNWVSIPICLSPQCSRDSAFLVHQAPLNKSKTQSSEVTRKATALKWTITNSSTELWQNNIVNSSSACASAQPSMCNGFPGGTTHTLRAASSNKRMGSESHCSRTTAVQTCDPPASLMWTQEGPILNLGLDVDKGGSPPVPGHGCGHGRVPSCTWPWVWTQEGPILHLTMGVDTGVFRPAPGPEHTLTGCFLIHLSLALGFRFLFLIGCWPLSYNRMNA